MRTKPLFTRVAAVVLLASFVVGTASLPARAATVETFDTLAEGLVIDSLPSGVIFTRNARVIRPQLGTHSGTNALSTHADPTKEFDGAPMTMEFVQTQQRVRLFAGLDESASGPIAATLRAYNTAGTLLSHASASLTGPSAITREMTVSASSAVIKRVVLEYASTYTEIIDDLEFDNAAPPPADTTRPIVRITAPSSGAHTAQDGIALTATITEERRLRSLTLTIRSITSAEQRAVSLGWGGTVPNLTYGPTLVGPLYPGRNRLTLVAEDFGGNTASAGVEVIYDAPPAGMNVYARAIEITQGVQEEILERDAPRFVDDVRFAPRTYGADPPLVEGKDTVVRLYGAITQADRSAEGVPARLYGFRNGTMLRGSPLLPIRKDPTGTVIATVTLTPGATIRQMRDSTQGTWNFNLPSAWTTGTITLLAEVNPLGSADRLPECVNCNDRANSFADLTVGFNETGVILVRPWTVVHDFGGINVYRGYHPVAFFGTRLYPIAREDIDVSFINDGTLFTSSRTACDIMDDLALADWSKGGYANPGTLNGPLRKTVVTGIYSSAAGVDRAGCARRPGTFQGVGAGRVSVAVDLLAGVQPVDMFGAAPHEIGHNFGLKHASNDHGECGGGACETNFPYPHGSIGVTGFDPWYMVAVPLGSPAGSVHEHDVMSYGGSIDDSWMSPLNYKRLYNKLRVSGPEAMRRAAAAPVRERRLLVGGRIASDGRAMLRPIIEATVEPVGVADGPYEAVLLDASGNALHRKSFDAIGSDHGASSGATFQLSLPVIPGTARVVIHRGPTTLADRSGSRAPSVRLVSPAAGAQLGAKGTVEVRWEAADVDGDTLRFDVEYSRDGGTTWSPLAIGTQKRTLAVDLARLPGSDRASVRVVATDGFGKTTDTIDVPMKVARKDPTIQIASPVSGARYQAGAAIPLEASAGDPEDRHLRGEQLRWVSDRDGVIGTGERTTMHGASIGKHTITLQAKDADGKTAAAKVTIEIVAARSNDTTPPTLVSATPASGATDVRPSAAVLATFSEPVAGVTRGFALLDAAGAVVGAVVTPGGDATSATLAPKRPLKSRTKYTVVLTTGITDRAGNRLRKTSWTFRTR